MCLKSFAASKRERSEGSWRLHHVQEKPRPISGFPTNVNVQCATTRRIRILAWLHFGDITQT